MSSPSKGEVIYGNPGLASYDIQTKQWHFPRSNAENVHFHIIKQETIFPGQLRNESSCLNANDIPDLSTSAQDRQRNVKALLSTFPEFIPGANALPTLEQGSQAVTDLAGVYEPLASDYLTYGLIDYDEETQIPVYLQSRKILASVTGATRHLVRLNLVGEVERIAEGDSYNTHLIVDHYQDKHAVFWGGTSTTAIQQLCFSRNTTGSSLLAVRRHNGVDILKPTMRTEYLHRSKLTPSEIGTGEHSNKSYMDPNWLACVSFEHFDGPGVADFEFHPQIATKFAILNTRGKILILEIKEHSRAHKRWNIIHLAQIDRFDNIAENSLGEPWGTIIWAIDGNSILLARRNSFSAYDLSISEPTIVNLPLGVPGQQSRILDAQCEAVLTNFCFILTTSSLIVVSQSVPNDESSASLQEDYQVLVSIIHYRDSNDMTLRLSVEAHDQSAFILIYSRVVPLITGYKMVLDQETKRFKHITDPFRFVLPRIEQLGSPTTPFPLSKAEISISYMSMRAIQDDSPIEDRASENCYLDVFVLDDDLKLTRMIVMACNFNMLPSSLIVTPLSTQADHQITNVYDRNRTDFIVEDDTDSEGERRFRSSRNHLLLQNSQGTASLSNDLSFLADEVNSRLDTSYSVSRPLSYLKISLEFILGDRRDISAGVHLLSDFLSTSISVDAIDAVSYQTVDLLNTIGAVSKDAQITSFNGQSSQDLPPKVESNVLLFGQILQDLQSDNQIGQVLLIPIYEKLLRLYLQVLHPSAPLNLRVWLEKMVRHAAMQLFMTSHSIRASSSQNPELTDDLLESMPDAPEPQQISLSTHTQSTDPNVGNLNQLSEGVNTLRLSSQSPGPGYAPSSQQTSDNRSESSKKIGATLSRYVEFDAVSLLHRTIRRNVPEWHVGTVPTGLEWRSMSRSDSQENPATIRTSRQHKGDKGKERAASEAESAITAAGSDLESQDIIRQGSYRTATPDVDDGLLASQVSTSSFSQALPRMNEQHYATASTSQLLPIHSSQAVSQNSQNRNQRSSSKKNLLFRKRPSGFK